MGNFMLVWIQGESRLRCQDNCLVLCSIVYTNGRKKKYCLSKWPYSLWRNFFFTKQLGGPKCQQQIFNLSYWCLIVSSMGYYHYSEPDKYLMTMTYHVSLSTIDGFPHPRTLRCHSIEWHQMQRLQCLGSIRDFVCTRWHKKQCCHPIIVGILV